MNILEKRIHHLSFNLSWWKWWEKYFRIALLLAIKSKTEDFKWIRNQGDDAEVVLEWYVLMSESLFINLVIRLDLIPLTFPLLNVLNHSIQIETG